jgi:uncharacterized protein (TIGR00369 family)
MDDAELMQRFSTMVPPTAKLLGMEVLSMDSAAGITRMRFVVKPEFCNPAGNMQGGIFAAMMDDAAATAIVAASHAKSPGKRIFVPTLEFKVSFFAPAKLGSAVVCEGRAVKLGRSIAFAEVDMTDEASGRLLARMTTTTMPTAFPDAPMLVRA